MRYADTHRSRCCINTPAVNPSHSSHLGTGGPHVSVHVEAFFTERGLLRFHFISLHQTGALTGVVSTAAENLIALLQARDAASVQSLSPPVIQGPDCCTYNSHGSSIQESPSERETQTSTQTYATRRTHTDTGVVVSVSRPHSRLSEHAQFELHLSRVRQRVGRAGRHVVELGR